MSHEVFPSEDKKYIILKLKGKINGKAILKGIQEAHKLGDELCITKHLMDLSEARNIDSDTDKYYFANEDIQNYPGINMKVKVAVLVRPDDHSHDFAETVTRNAGQDITLFRDKESAIRYLLQ